MDRGLSDERLAELIEFHKENLRGTMPKEVSDYYSDEVSALTELAEYRAREAESTWKHSPKIGDGPGQEAMRRLVGPWEAVSDDE